MLSLIKFPNIEEIHENAPTICYILTRNINYSKSIYTIV